MDLDLKGKRALVTGASKGIGLGVASALAGEGVHLTLASRSADRLEAEAETLRSAFGVTVETAAVDLSQSADQQTLAEQVGTPDILVNNAGAIPGGTITDIDEGDLARGLGPQGIRLHQPHETAASSHGGATIGGHP